MDYAVARRNMIDGQIKPNRVTDPAVVAALSEVPREAFAPKHMRAVAYVDEALPIGRDRYLMEPMVLARLLQAAEVQPTDIALVIGTGTGYSAAVLARLANTVVALESDAQLAGQATATLAGLGIDNVVFTEGSLGRGYPAQAPYDVILFGGAVAEVSPAILDQLAEGGRLVTVVGSRSELGRATLYQRTGGRVASRVLFDAGTPLLPGFGPKTDFTL